MWQSAETAPKDGTVILVWDHRMLQGKGMPRIAVWGKNLNLDCYGWLCVDTAWEIEFSHWMPLPPPPYGGC